MAPKWFIRKDSQEFGPVTAKELRRLAEAKMVSLDDLVKFGDHEQWLPARWIFGLLEVPSSI